MKLIYLVEDYASLRDGVMRYLQASGYDVQAFENLKEARKAFADREPDLLIQDVMLPDGDGFEFVKEIRERSDCPVIFMTAKITESDRIMGFEIGADDYITKPFSPKELVLRVQAVFRRADAAAASAGSSSVSGISLWKLGDVTMKMDDASHHLFVGGEEVSLTVAEWKVLGFLARNAGEVVGRDVILLKCFGYEIDSYRRVVDTHVKNIRTKLERYGDWIETVRRSGYMFVGEAVSSEGAEQ